MHRTAFGARAALATALLATALAGAPAVWGHEPEQEEEDTGPWSASAELGYVSTTGNTETESFNGHAQVGYDHKRWSHHAQVDVLKASEDDQTTADRTEFLAKSRYYLAEYDYLFARVRYEDDRFSGYDYQATEALGYGHRAIRRDDLTLDLEAGAGVRHRRAADESSREDDALVLLAGSLAWSVSPTSEFTEDVTVEWTDDNTYTESITALSVRINGNLAMKTSYTYRNNSDVPAGTDNTDTVTAVTLVFNY